MEPPRCSTPIVYVVNMSVPHNVIGGCLYSGVEAPKEIDPIMRNNVQYTVV